MWVFVSRDSFVFRIVCKVDVFHNHPPWEGGFKSAQVPDMFLKEFPIACHIYPVCFGKCCPPFTNVGGPKERNSILQNRTFYYFEEPPWFHFL